VVEQAPGPADRAAIVTFELEQLGEPLHHREEAPAQPLALSDDPVVVTVGKEVARIQAGGGLKRAAHVGGLVRRLGARRQLLELNHVKPVGGTPGAHETAACRGERGDRPAGTAGAAHRR